MAKKAKATIKTKSAESKLTMVSSMITKEQIMQIFSRTPTSHISTRPAKGGGTWDYVTGVYVKKILNYVFGWLWDFEVISYEEKFDQIQVLGKLTVKDKKGNSVTKMQFGRADIKFKRGTQKALDYGNDLKAAATDSLKKCASELGIASDVYGKNEFKEVGVSRIQKKQEKGQANRQTTEISYKCQGCFSEGEETLIARNVADYSKRVFGKPLCAKHQKEEQAIRNAK